MKNTAYLYLRASSAKQDKSVEQQRTACRKFAKDNNISILGEFEDDGISAFSGKERTGYNNLLEACKSGKAKFVLMWSIDRFSRQYNEGMVELLLLARLGVQLMDTINGVYNANDLGGAIKQVVGMWTAEEYSTKLSANVKRGQKRMKDDGFLHGMPPLGYKIERVQGGATWIPDTTATYIVEEIFDLYSKGFTFQGIAKVLNDLGWKPKRANYFSAITVAQILRNPAYGGFQQSRNYTGHRLESMRKAKIKTFINKEVWKEVFEAASVQNRNAVGTRRKNPLTGKVFCPKCGEPAHVISGEQNISRYRCRGVRGTICNNRSTINVKELEHMIIKIYKDAITYRGGIAIVAQEIVEHQLEMDKQQVEMIKPLLDRLDSIDSEEANIIDLAASGGTTKMLSERLRKLSEEREQLEATIDSMKDSVTRITAMEALDRAMKWLNDLDNNFRSVAEIVTRIEIHGKGKCMIDLSGKKYDVDLGANTYKILKTKKIR